MLTMSAGFGTTVGRVGFGAFPLAFSLFLLSCLFFERRVMPGLAFVATLDSVVLAVRVASMFVDSSRSAEHGTGAGRDDPFGPYLCGFAPRVREETPRRRIVEALTRKRARLKNDWLARRSDGVHSFRRAALCKAL